MYIFIPRHPLSAVVICNYMYNKKKNICLIQQQVPLLLPCFNFAQIAILSLTFYKLKFLKFLHFKTYSLKLL